MHNLLELKKIILLYEKKIEKEKIKLNNKNKELTCLHKEIRNNNEQQENIKKMLSNLINKTIDDNLTEFNNNWKELIELNIFYKIKNKELTSRSINLKKLIVIKNEEIKNMKIKLGITNQKTDYFKKLLTLKNIANNHEDNN